MRLYNITNSNMINLVKINVDPSRLEDYKQILKEEIEISLRTEPGVYVLYALSDDNRPNEFTIVEVFKEQEAYDKHCQSPQLLKYFAETKEIVQNIEIIKATALVEGLRMK